MADEEIKKDQEYDEPSLTDLEDVSGGGIVCQNGSIDQPQEDEELGPKP